MRPPIAYVDRRDGTLHAEPIWAHAWLDWCYNRAPGRWLTDLVLSRRWVSRCYGWLHKTRWSRRWIPAFVERLGIDLDEAVVPPGGFRSFNDFFIREIDLSRRPVDPDPATCVAPADARVLALPVVEAGRRFAIKRAEFELGTFLADPALAAEFAGGSMLVCRLYLNDYHHFHFPVAGVPGPARAVAGRYLAVTPYARRWLVPTFAQNHRMLTVFESAHFGRLVLAEVGAFTVGSIRQAFRPGVPVRKGERKGHFELGGSVVVVCFRPGAIRLDPDLVARSQEGLETRVRMGEPVGRA